MDTEQAHHNLEHPIVHQQHHQHEHDDVHDDGKARVHQASHHQVDQFAHEHVRRVRADDDAAEGVDHNPRVLGEQEVAILVGMFFNLVPSKLVVSREKKLVSKESYHDHTASEMEWNGGKLKSA
jgi:hypothetical protein